MGQKDHMDTYDDVYNSFLFELWRYFDTVRYWSSDLCDVDTWIEESVQELRTYRIKDTRGSWFTINSDWVPTKILG